MNNAYKINNQEKQLLELLTKIVLTDVEKNGTDILLGRFNKRNNKRVKNEFDKICETGIGIEPELQVSLNKYKIKDKEYYQISLCSNSLNSNENNYSNDKKLEKKNVIQKNNQNDSNSEKDKIKITERQLEILKLIYENPNIKYDEIQNCLGISKGTICIDIKVLKKLKVLERIGTSDGKWEINKSLIKDNKIFLNCL